MQNTKFETPINRRGEKPNFGKEQRNGKQSQKNTPLQITQDKLLCYRDCFDKLDQDCSGLLTREEVIAALRLIATTTTSAGNVTWKLLFLLFPISWEGESHT